MDITLLPSFKAQSSELHTFRSQGILLGPISNENSKAQILDIIRQVTLALQLRLDWRTLPDDWLAAENAIFPTANHVSLFIPLRDAVLAGSDGDGFSDFHIEPLNVGSATHRIYPRCVTVAGLKIPSLSAGKVLSYGINIFVQFLPRHWRLDHLTEALVFRNLPFDTKGDLTRLLLHYLEEFLSKAHSCENVTDPVTFFQKMSYRGYILFRIHFKSNFFLNDWYT